MAKDRYLYSSTGEHRVKHAGRFVAFLVLLVIITLAALVYFLPSFKVTYDTIKITGGERYHFEDIIYAAKNELIGVHILKIDEDAVVELIQDDNPYLVVENIIRELPNGVEIVVKEREAIYQFSYNGQYYDAADNRVIMSEARSKDPALMQIEGLEISQPIRGTISQIIDDDRQKDFDTIIASLQKYGFMDKVRTIDMSEETNIILYMRQDFKVIVGLPTQIDDKISYLGSALNSIIENGHTSGVLDISVIGQLSYSPYPEE